jgi:hypothetical protein
MTEFFEPSLKALHPHMTRTGGWFSKYEALFIDCPVGKSFQLPIDVAKSTSTVRSTVHKYGKAKGKDFTVIKHELCYEIYRKE